MIPGSVSEPQLPVGYAITRVSNTYSPVDSLYEVILPNCRLM